MATSKVELFLLFQQVMKLIIIKCTSIMYYASHSSSCGEISENDLT